MKNLQIFENFDPKKLKKIITKIVKPGTVLGIPTFYSVGYALDAVNILIENKTKDLTVISNDSGLPGKGTGKLLDQGQIKLLIASFMGTNSDSVKMYNEGQLNAKIYPQGTLIEMINCAAKGMPGLLTPTGVGTDIESEADGFDIIDNKRYLFYKALKPQVAFVKAHKADIYGNICFHKASRNFHEATAMAADFVIVEVDKVVQYLHPENIHVQKPYIDVIYQSSGQWREELKVAPKKLTNLSKERELIVKKAAHLLKKRYPKGASVNLGIGTPLEVANYLEKKDNIWLMSENGIYGMGKTPQTEEDIDHEIINAGRGPASIMFGGSFFDSIRSFGMIRSGRIDATILGGFQVSASGDLANYKMPGKAFPGIGGGMDLVTGAKTVIIATEHTAKGKSRIVEKCDYPLTGKGVVNWIVTELAVIEVTPDGLLLHEVAPREDNDIAKAIQEVIENTEAKLQISKKIKFMEF